MTIKEIVNQLVNAESYLEVRKTISDATIELIRDHMPIYYDLIKEKEEAYQLLIKFLNTK